MGQDVEPVCRPDGDERTFFMYYPDAEEKVAADRFSHASGYSLRGEITVRGSSASYGEVVRSRKGGVVAIGPVLWKMGPRPLAQALFELAVRGVHVDFVETYHRDERGFRDVLTSFVDLRKRSGEEKAELAASFPRHYVAKARGSLPWAVVDRFAQPAGVDYAAGRFRPEGVLARFREREDAAAWCASRNGAAGGEPA